MILIIVWDGLRPDMITPERTPNLWRRAQQGVFCRASHAAFPTATRINSATLSTGCYPGRHGIPDNELYVPAIEPRKAFSCADWRLLQRMADLEGGRLLSVPTLGELLRDAGLRMASGGSGSPGTTYLTNPTVTGPIVNWAVAWPEEMQSELVARYGGMLDEEADSPTRNAFVLRALRESVIPAVRPDVVTLWLTEPDHTQHYHGLGSPEALAILRQLDAESEEFVAHLENDPLCAPLTCFLVSDHGFNSVAHQVAPDAELAAAGLKRTADSAEIVRTSNSFYLNDPSPERLDELLTFLVSRPWIGALLLKDEVEDPAAGVMRQSAAFGGHARAAQWMFAYRWSEEANGFGVAGSVHNASALAATHGSASPYAINNTLVAWGAGIKRGGRSDVPCGLVDIAPTVLHLLGVARPDHMDGRVLRELLAEGPDPAEMVVGTEELSVTYGSGAAARRQVAHYSLAEGRRYLDRITWTPLCGEGDL